MTSFTPHDIEWNCPVGCGRDCKVAQCPKCRGLAWIEDWEVWDDFAVCPVNDCIVPSYTVTFLRLCRSEVEAEAAREEEAETKKHNRKRKPKATPLFTE